MGGRQNFYDSWLDEMMGKLQGGQTHPSQERLLRHPRGLPRPHLVPVDHVTSCKSLQLGRRISRVAKEQMQIQRAEPPGWLGST